MPPIAASLDARVETAAPSDRVTVASSMSSIRVLAWRHYLEAWGIRCFVRAQRSEAWATLLRGVRTIPLALIVRRRDFPRARELLSRRGRR